MSATLTFSWSKPTSLASCTDCSFEYKYALEATSLDGLTPIPVSFGTLSVTIPGLVNGESYHYAVRTICGPVQSKWSYGTTVVCDTPPIDTPTPTPTPTPTVVPDTPTPTPTVVPDTPTPTPTVVPDTPTPTPTVVPDTNYEFLLCYDPYETALATYVATYTKLINGGFTGEPLLSDTITISGSPNIDAVYQYNGTTTASANVPVITAINAYDCTGVPIGTPTPTPTNTPTPTPTPGTCYEYVYGPAQSGCTIYWTNCSGTPQSTFVAVGQYHTVGCAQSGTLTGCGQFTQGSPC